MFHFIMKLNGFSMKLGEKKKKQESHSSNLMILYLMNSCKSAYSNLYLTKSRGYEELSAKTAANKACTRLVGVAAFSGSFRGSRLIPSKWRYLVPPTSG